MPEIEAIKSLFDLGGVVVVTVMLWIVWRRLNDVTDRLIDILAELRAQSIVLAQQAQRNVTEA
jgi:hypothetical protein